MKGKDKKGEERRKSDRRERERERESVEKCENVLFLKHFAFFFTFPIFSNKTKEKW